MAKSKLPIVTDDHIQDYPEVKIGSDAWFVWLNKLGTSFRYEPKQINGSFNERKAFTVVSRIRKGSNTLFWVAVRKVDKKVRQEYLGLTDELDYEKLQLACDNLSLNPDEYQEYKKSKNNNSDENNFDSYPNKNDELSEIKIKYEQLKKQLLELKPKLETKEHPKFSGIKGYRANGASGLRTEIENIIKSLEE